MHPSAPSSAHPAIAPPGGRTRARRRVLTAVIAAMAPIAALLTVISVPTAASATTVPGPPSGWSTVFSDDFEGSAGSGIDSQWIYDTGAGSSFGTGEIETMTNSTGNVYQDGNGDLDITAVNNGGNWTSGRVQTSSANVGAPAGGELEVTASIEQPNGGPGYWPAFWMLGPGQWPENGEIDIMEDVNSLSELSGTIHCGTDPGGPCNEPDGIGSGLVGCGGCQSGYNTYTMILNRTNTSDESITFYLDGNEYFSVDEGQVGTSTWQAAFDHNLSIILDLAMGGSYPNGQCGCTTPTSASASSGTMSVQYVAAYETSS
jgi:beta-glucanase (GH16 family)